VDHLPSLVSVSLAHESGSVDDGIEKPQYREERTEAGSIGIWESRDRSTVKYPSDCLHSRDDISGRVDEVTCPVLIVHGEEDLAIPIETAPQLCDDLSDYRGLIPVPGAAHASNMTHPEIVTPSDRGSPGHHRLSDGDPRAKSREPRQPAGVSVLGS
jgi:pimeloyl-ACP methyl ester carboxylesterase